MKLMVYIPSTGPYELGEQVYQELLAIYPGGKKPYISFQMKLPVDDLRTKAVLDCLQRHGFRPNIPYSGDETKTYLMSFMRGYEASDYEQAEYLQPWPQVTPHASYVYRPESDLLEYERENDLAKPFKAGITMLHGKHLFVTTKIKEVLERSGMKHLVISLPMRVQGPKSERYEGQWWELASDFVLPPVSPLLVLVDGADKPFDSSKGGLCDYLEGLTYPEVLYRPPELHYRASDLARVEAFDMAKTKETFGGDVGGQHWVASQRFYRFCVEHKLPMKWTPVRLDPE